MRENTYLTFGDCLLIWLSLAVSIFPANGVTSILYGWEIFIVYVHKYHFLFHSSVCGHLGCRQCCNKNGVQESLWYIGLESSGLIPRCGTAGSCDRFIFKRVCLFAWFLEGFPRIHDDNLQLLIVLLKAPKGWDYRHAAPCPLCKVLEMEPRASCMVGKHCQLNYIFSPIFNFF